MRAERVARSTLGVILGLLLFAGCGERGSATSEPADGSHREPENDRVVSLAPAITQMMIQLDQADRLVGVAEHDAPAERLAQANGQELPVVGSFVRVDTERLLSTRPTRVLISLSRDGVPASLRDLAESGMFELTVFGYPRSVDDVAEMLSNDDPAQPSIGATLGVQKRAKELRRRMLDQLASLQELTSSRDAPSVLLVFSTGPVMVSGPGSVNDELLRYAGGTNAAADANLAAPTYDREALIGLQPEVILLLRPGAPPLTNNDSRLADFDGLPIPAVESQRIALINDPLTLLPSTSMPRIAAAMAKAIHPELAGSIDAITTSQPLESPATELERATPGVAQ